MTAIKRLSGDEYQGLAPLWPAATASRIFRVTKRRAMTYRVVPLGSREAENSQLGGTVAERKKMVAELSRLAWIASGRPFPVYSRAKIPIRLSTLAEQGRDDRA